MNDTPQTQTALSPIPVLPAGSPETDQPVTTLEPAKSSEPETGTDYGLALLEGLKVGLERFEGMLSVMEQKISALSDSASVLQDAAYGEGGGGVDPDPEPAPPERPDGRGKIMDWG